MECVLQGIVFCIILVLCCHTSYHKQFWTLICYLVPECCYSVSIWICICFQKVNTQEIATSESPAQKDLNLNSQHHDGAAGQRDGGTHLFIHGHGVGHKTYGVIKTLGKLITWNLILFHCVSFWPGFSSWVLFEYSSFIMLLPFAEQQINQSCMHLFTLLWIIFPYRSLQSIIVAEF